jgi:hypothetical protein
MTIKRSKPFMDNYLPQDAPDVSPIADALFSQPHFGGHDPLPGSVAEVSHEEINDGANGYDDEDDTPEDDGQPSEYTEWQDYMGGDEYYDHSENGCW